MIGEIMDLVRRKPLLHSNGFSESIIFKFIRIRLNTGVITRVLKAICHVDEPTRMLPEQCLGFKVYPPSGFYAIPWPKWEMFFDPNKLNETIEMTKDSIIIHVWNNHSIKRKLNVNTKAAYNVIAKKNCPQVFSSCGDYF